MKCFIICHDANIYNCSRNYMNKTLKAIKNKLTKFKDWCLKVALLAFQISFLMIVLYRVIPVPITPFHIIRVFEQIGGSDEVRLKKSWRGINDIGDKMILAAVTSEDPKFFQHFGFDFEQIQKAIERSINGGKKLRGASTISQQTAKNLFFTPKRSWIRKGLEMYVTICLEVLWTKKRIIEVYLNIIEMGNGIYGAEAAAEFYFNKSSDKLTKGEAAMIVACFPNPRRWRPDKPTRYIARKQAIITRFMNKIGDLPWK